MYCVAAYQFVHLLTMTKDFGRIFMKFGNVVYYKNLVSKQEFRENLSDSRSTEGRK
jgi:hypothetical protein